MIPIQIEITGYNFDRNVCVAQLSNGNFIEVDPFVGCAVRLSDDDYVAGKGADLVGKKFVLTSYSVYPSTIVPHENGIVPVE